MPIYEYTCEGCGSKFDQLQRSMSTEVKPKCPKCGSVKTQSRAERVRGGG
jgi:putative FmdB family regulatory protein